MYLKLIEIICNGKVTVIIGEYFMINNVKQIQLIFF